MAASVWSMTSASVVFILLIIIQDIQNNIQDKFLLSESK